MEGGDLGAKTCGVGKLAQVGRGIDGVGGVIGEVCRDRISAAQRLRRVGPEETQARTARSAREPMPGAGGELGEKISGTLGGKDVGKNLQGIGQAHADLG